MKSTTTESITKEYDAFVFDLDGVVWKGMTPIKGAVDKINELISNKKEVRFLTNNATKTRGTTAKRLLDLGLKTKVEHVYTSGYATALYLNKNYPGSKIHIMGTEELKKEIELQDFKTVDRGADFVVAGLDKSFTYEKLNQALQNVVEDGAKIIACNMDNSYPTEEEIRPGAGSIVTALMVASGRPTEIVIGKPSTTCYDLILEELDFPKPRCLMVGDKIQTDLLGARQAGMSTCMVLSGIGCKADIEELSFYPEHVIDSVCSIA